MQMKIMRASQPLRTFKASYKIVPMPDKSYAVESLRLQKENIDDTYRFRKPLRVDIKFVGRGYWAWSDDVGVEAFGETEQEAQDGFQRELSKKYISVASQFPLERTPLQNSFFGKMNWFLDIEGFEASRKTENGSGLAQIIRIEDGNAVLKLCGFGEVSGSEYMLPLDKIHGKPVVAEDIVEITYNQNGPNADPEIKEAFNLV